MDRENERNIDYIDSMVIDPSLLTVPGLELLGGLLEEGNLQFTITADMKELLENREAFRDVLLQWGEYPGQVNMAYDTVQRSELPYRAKVVQLNQDMELLISEHLISEIRYSISRKRNIYEFLSNEMALAISAGIPILCISSSPEWKIVEFFKRVGAKIGNTIDIQFDKKKQFLKTTDFRKLTIASALSAAIIVATGGSAAATLGCAAVTITVYSDP